MARRRRNALAALAVAAFSAVALAAAWRWRPHNNPNHPHGVTFVCTTGACRHEFTLSMRQLGKHHEKDYGRPVPCPSCGGTRTVQRQAIVADADSTRTQ